MGEFTDDDRTRLVETHTIMKGMAKVVADHEKRIRFTERVSWAWLLSVPGVSAVLAKIGIGGG